MARNEEIDNGLLAFARKIAAIPKEIAGNGRSAALSPGASPPVTADKSEMGNESPETPVSHGHQTDRDARNTSSAATPGPRGKQLRNVDEMASLHEDLAHDGELPDRGFVVTVYGSNPWNAMLTIRPEAGPRIDRQLWCSRVPDIGVQFRNEFDMADEQTA
jgi:hypothetical protein